MRMLLDHAGGSTGLSATSAYGFGSAGDPAMIRFDESRDQSIVTR